MRQGAEVLGATQGDGQQPVVLADLQQARQGAQVHMGVEFFQADHHRGVAEEIRRLLFLFRQLLGEAPGIQAHHFNHGNGQHAALEIEYRILFEQVEVCINSHVRSTEHS